ncbi:MAG: cytochrome, partial [Frankiales bacterium]|nr:cytochrome [Frankiales bacterium]
WTGVPLPADRLAARTADLKAMVDAPGAVGARHRRGRAARRAAETGLAGTVERVRRETSVGDPSPLTAIATHRDHHRRLLEPRVAAVELINLLRPIVAIDRFVTFAALALHRNPQWRDRVAADQGDAELFVQEVRRFYPFFPAAAARVTDAFEWGGHSFPAGRRVLLDLYGTDRHPGTWSQPDVSDPERFGTGGRPRSTWCRRAAATIAPDTAAPASGSRSR